MPHHYGLLANENALAMMVFFGIMTYQLFAVTWNRCHRTPYTTDFHKDKVQR
jgi:hypothetical protein